jgi:hypothetical protein
VHWTGTIELATCERSTCSMALTMTPASVKFSPTNTYLAQILFAFPIPAARLSLVRRSRFVPRSKQHPNHYSSSEAINGRLMISNKDAELVADASR